jgi:serine/threonine-protein kinase
VAAEIFGKYQLLHKLATGGMGEVWLARQSGPAGFDRFVAVKRLLPNLAENNEFVQMFLDEARLVARLTHPNICQVYEFGSEKGMYYLSMEYMHGEPLSSLLERSLKEKKPIDTGLVAYIIAQALDGLHFAHERKDEHGVPLGIVHRDISPSNIFVTYDGTVKLLDFGIAKAAHRLTQTVAGAIKGKFGYIAPEVYRGETIDRRVDLFAMGVVLWELLLRRRLYKRETEYEVLRAIVEEAPPDPRQYDPKIPEELCVAAMKALAKQPADRFQTGQEMRKQIAAYLRVLPKEIDADGLAELMQNLYGQVWIDLRASVLDSFKDASGDISGADVLNATKTDSSVSKVSGGGGNFSRSVNSPPPLSGTALSVPTPPPKRSNLPVILAGVGGALVAAIGAGWFLLKPGPETPTFPQPQDPIAQGPDTTKPLKTTPPGPSGPSGAIAPTGAVAAATGGQTAPPVFQTPIPPPITMGTVVVTAQPAGAKVRLDDRTPTLVPATFDKLTPGTRHELVISAAGYKDEKKTILVAAGAASYDLSLQPLATKHTKPPKGTPGIGPTKPPRDNVPDVDTPLDPWGGK